MPAPTAHSWTRKKEVNKAKKIGTQDYCMGGGLVVRTAAAVPNRVGAGASFHGGGLVTNMPNSPHLLAPKIKARMYFGIASNDDMAQPDAKDKLREAFAAAKLPADIEVYPALHGWCVPDMPLQNGKPIYSKPDAERAWGKLVALYKTGLDSSNRASIYQTNEHRRRGNFEIGRILHLKSEIANWTVVQSEIS